MNPVLMNVLFRFGTRLRHNIEMKRCAVRQRTEESREGIRVGSDKFAHLLGSKTTAEGTAACVAEIKVYENGALWLVLLQQRAGTSLCKDVVVDQCQKCFVFVVGNRILSQPVLVFVGRSGCLAGSQSSNIPIRPRRTTGIQIRTQSEVRCHSILGQRVVFGQGWGGQVLSGAKEQRA